MRLPALCLLPPSIEQWPTLLNPGDAKARFNAIAEQLAQLSTAFTNNVLDGTKAFSLLLTSPEQVAGLPSSALGMFAQAAKAKGHPDASVAAGPWLVTLDAPSYMPVMQHARDRSLHPPHPLSSVSGGS